MQAANPMRKAAWAARLRPAVGPALALCLLVLSAPSAASGSETTPERVRSALSAYLRARAPQPPTDIVLPKLTTFALPGVPPASVEIDLRTAHKGPFVGRVPVMVVLSVAGRELKRGVITAHVRIEVPVWVATRALRRGETVGPDDIRRERRDLASLRGTRLRDPSSLVGMRVVRSVRAGAVWQAKWVDRAPVVSRGETVRLQLSRGGLRIDAVGRAREDGRVGDWIRVLMVSSRREVNGRVESDGVVHVRF